MRLEATVPDNRGSAFVQLADELGLSRSQLIDEVTIETTTGKPQSLGMALHLQGHVRLPASFLEDAKFAAGRPPAFGYWNDVRSSVFSDRASFDVDYRGTILRVTVDVSGEVRVWHGSTPDSPPGRREGLYFETTGESATFTTVFEPLDPS